MNRRSFILSAAGAAFGGVMTGGGDPLHAQDASVLTGARRYSIGGISCIFQSDSAIFLRDDRPIIAYRTTFRSGDQEGSDKRTRQMFQTPFPCFTRLSSPTSLSPLSPLRRSAAAAFVCDNVNGVNYTAKISKKNALSCGQIRSNGLKWKGMSEIGSDGVLTKQLSWTFGVQGVFDDECKWINPDGRVQMTDSRRFRVAFYDKSRYGIYVTIDWYAVNDVQITANRNCLFGVQASAPLAPAGGGMMMNSSGVYGASEIYGRRANWTACWGRLQAENPDAVPDEYADLQEGVALMSHPSNLWGVSPWNTTPFGYMSPTHIPFLSKPWLLRAGEGVRLRYLILAYTGNPYGGQIDEIYRNYSSS